MYPDLEKVRSTGALSIIVNQLRFYVRSSAVASGRGLGAQAAHGVGLALLLALG